MTDLLSRQPEEAEYSPEPDNDRLLPPEGPIPDEADQETKHQDLQCLDEATVNEITLDELYDKVARAQ